MALVVIVQYINYLPLGINIDSKVMLYADDTNVLISGNNTHKLQVKFSMVLNTLNYGFMNHGLSLNVKKTKMLKFEHTAQNNTLFPLHYKNQLLQDVLHFWGQKCVSL
jgi:hypothetical protein